MENIKFNTCSCTGNHYSNLLTAVLIESSETVKPIAFKLSDGSSIFMPSDDMEDIASFILKLSELTIVADSSVELPIAISVNFKGELRSSDLNGPDIKVLEDVSLLRSFNSEKENTIYIVFDKGCNYRSAKDNRAVLDAMPIDMKDYRAIHSRFTQIDVVSKVNQDIDSEIVSMRVSSTDGKEKTKLVKALDDIITTFEKIKSSL